jgi:hypothetical protein
MTGFIQKNQPEDVVIRFAPLDLLPKEPTTKLQKEEAQAWARAEVMKAVYTYLYAEVNSGALSL